MSIADKLTTIAENVQKVYDTGKQAEYDRFWDALQNKGAGTNYQSRFLRFPVQIYNPKYDFIFETYYAAFNTFQEFEGTDIIKNSNFQKAYGGLQQTFRNCSNLVNARTLNVEGIVNKFVSAFDGCSALEEVRFEGTIKADGLSFWNSSYLSKESVLSVINHLSDDVTGKTVTFHCDSVYENFETEPGASDGDCSDEWYALLATKPNWTINLY